jgi:hypothetical protein
VSLSWQSGSRVVIEHLPSKPEALSSNPIIAKKKKKKKKGKKKKRSELNSQ